MEKSDSIRSLEQVVSYFTKGEGSLPDPITFMKYFETDPAFRSEYAKTDEKVRQYVSIWLTMNEPEEKISNEEVMNQIKRRFPDLKI